MHTSTDFTTFAQRPDCLALRAPAEDGSQLAAIGCSAMTTDVWNGSIYLVDCSTGSVRQRLVTYGGTCALEWLQLGPLSLFLSGGDDGAVYVWQYDPEADSDSEGKPDKKRRYNTRTNKDAAEGEETGDDAAEAAFDEDGIAVIGDAGADVNESVSESASLGIAHGGEKLAEVMFHWFDHSDIVSSLSTTPGGMVLSSSHDQTIKLWDLNDKIYPVRTFTSHKSDVNHVQWHPSENSLFASGGRDGCVLLWDERSSSPTTGRRVNAHCERVCWQSEHVLACGYSNGVVDVMDTRAFGKAMCSASVGAPVRDLAWHSPSPSSSSSSPLLAVASEDSVTRVLSFTGTSLTPSWKSTAHRDYATAVAWDDQGSLLSTSWDCSMHKHTTE